jgi:tRNA(Arg) A34 adenosine deaminase TadA
VLSRGGAIISLGVNSDRYCSVGKNHRSDEKGNPTYHAEISAILNLPRHVTKGATMYVARASKKDGTFRQSKPCTMCHEVLKERGIKRVIYSVDENTYGTYKF